MTTQTAILYVRGQRYKMPYTLEGKYGGWNARCELLDIQRHGPTKETALAMLRIAVQDYLLGGFGPQMNLNPFELAPDIKRF